MNTNTITIIIISLVILLFIGIGVLLIVLYKRGKKKAIQSLTWPETTGTIIQSRVATEYSTMGGDDDEHAGGQPMYFADVQYTYRVEEMLYISERLSFGGKRQYSNPQKAEEEAARYPEGSTVAVFYDPEKHKSSVLERSAKGSGAFLAAGIVFLGIGFITFIAGLIILL